MRQVITQCPACGLRYASRAMTTEAKRYQRRNGISASMVFTCPACDTQFEAYAIGYEPRWNALRAWWNRVTWNYLPLKIYTVVFVVVLSGVFYVQIQPVNTFPETFRLLTYAIGLGLIPAGMGVLFAMQSRFGCSGGVFDDDDGRKLRQIVNDPAFSDFEVNIWHREEDR